MIISLLFIIQLVVSVAALTKPSEDSWYQCPDGYEDQPLGAILKTRTTPGGLKTIVIPLNVAGSWQLLVRSSDSHGNPNCIVTTVIAPNNGDPNKLLSYQSAQDSAKLDCSTSYAIQNGASLLTVTTSSEMFLVSLALERGWYVTSSDYEGPKSAYTAGIQAGHAVLDAVRATLQTGDLTGISKDAKVAYWGYSGGSLASGWAAQLQPDYAPELGDQSIGAAVGGYVTDIASVAHSIDGSVFAGIIPLAVTGLANEYPDMNSEISGAFTSALAKFRFAQAGNFCIADGVVYYLLNKFFTGPLRYVTAGFDIFNHPVLKKVLDENTLAFNSSTTLPTMPLMIYHGKLDEVVPFSSVQRAVDQYCSNGIASLELNAVSTTGHLTEVVDGSTAAFAWLEARFAGKPAVEGCVQTTRLTNLDYPGVNSSLATVIQSAFATVFGSDIGPNGENIDLAQLIKTWIGIIPNINI